jgi:hypothetical protein
MRRLSVLIACVLLLAVTVHDAGAASTGKAVVSAPRPSSGTLVIGAGEHAVVDANPFDGPKDVTVRTTGTWAMVALRDARGGLAFLQLTGSAVPVPLYLTPFERSGLGAGRYTVTVAGVRPVTATFTLRGGHGRRHVAGRPSPSSFSAATLDTTVPAATNGTLPVVVPRGALVVAAAGYDATLGQASQQELCLVPSGDSCPPLSGSGGGFVSPGSSASSGYVAIVEGGRAPGRYDAIAHQYEVGVTTKAWEIAAVIA